MTEESTHEAVTAAMQEINRAWLEGRVDDLARLVDPHVVMVLPGFAGRVAGRDDFLAGFHDLSQNATVHQFREDDQQVDIVGDTAVVSFAYEMVYERSGGRYRATGRDLWVFARQGNAWLAVWRTMLDMDENAD